MGALNRAAGWNEKEPSSFGIFRKRVDLKLAPLCYINEDACLFCPRASPLLSLPLLSSHRARRQPQQLVGLPKDPQPHSKPHVQCAVVWRKVWCLIYWRCLTAPNVSRWITSEGFWEATAFLCRVMRLQNAAAAIWKDRFSCSPPSLPAFISETWPVFLSSSPTRTCF